MYSQRQDPHPSPLELTLQPSSTVNIPSSDYLRVPEIPKSPSSLSTPDPDLQADTDAPLIHAKLSTTTPVPSIIEPSPYTTFEHSSTNSTALTRSSVLSKRLYMSIYSSSSVDTDFSDFSNPPARSFRVSTTSKMSRKITAVRHHRND
jgi:hypothetical protein